MNLIYLEADNGIEKLRLNFVAEVIAWHRFLWFTGSFDKDVPILFRLQNDCRLPVHSYVSQNTMWFCGKAILNKHNTNCTHENDIYVKWIGVLCMYSVSITAWLEVSQ